MKDLLPPGLPVGLQFADSIINTVEWRTVYLELWDVAQICFVALYQLYWKGRRVEERQDITEEDGQQRSGGGILKLAVKLPPISHRIFNANIYHNNVLRINRK